MPGFKGKRKRGLTLTLYKKPFRYRLPVSPPRKRTKTSSSTPNLKSPSIGTPSIFVLIACLLLCCILNVYIVRLLIVVFSDLWQVGGFQWLEAGRWFSVTCDRSVVFSDLWQVGGFQWLVTGRWFSPVLWFPLPIKLITTISLKYL